MKIAAIVIALALGFLEFTLEDPGSLFFALAVLIFFITERSTQKKKKRRLPEGDSSAENESEPERGEGFDGQFADAEELDGDQTIVIPDLFKNPPPEETRQHQTVLRDEDWRTRQKPTDGKIYTPPQDPSADGVTTESEALAKSRRGSAYDVKTEREALESDAHTHTDGMIHSRKRLLKGEPLMPQEKIYARPAQGNSPEAQTILADAAPVFTGDELVNAVIMAEILGKPKALQ